MEQIIDLNKAEAQVFQKVKKLITAGRTIVAKDPPNLKSGIDILKQLRKAIYEDLNQIQHEEMILRAARLLESSHLPGQQVEWYWNPRQTGTVDEPDLQGLVAGRIAVSAEITASEDPKGGIDRRMAITLEKLSKLPGKTFFFVCTDSMEKRARTKVERAGYHIDVRRI